jgi:hypothetical protein
MYDASTRFCPSCGTQMHFTSRAWAGPPPPPAGFGARPQPDSGRSALVWLLVGACVLVVILLGAGLYVGGVFSSAPTVTAPSASPPATTTPSPTSPAPRSPAPSSPASTVTYTGNAFSIAYPTNWSVTGAEAPKSWGTDTTIVSPSDSNVLIRVDVSPNIAATDPMSAAQPVISALEQQPGYQQLDLTRGTFHGYPAVHWSFMVRESGVLLRKEDEFFSDTSNGSGVAILTQAPASQYPSLSSEFASLRQSLSMS